MQFNYYNIVWKQQKQLRIGFPFNIYIYVEKTPFVV